MSPERVSRGDAALTAVRRAEPKAEGLASMGVGQLQAAKAGLEQKKQELLSSESWWVSRLRAAEADLLIAATAAASNQYAERVTAEIKTLHAVIDGAHQLLGRATDKSLPLAWRTEKLYCPPLADRKYQANRDMYSSPLLVEFSSGAGVQGAIEDWRRACKAACGTSSL